MTSEDRVVLFDMDGVLLEGHANDTTGYEAGLTRTLEEYDLTVTDAERAGLAGYEYDRAFVEACEAVGVDPVAFYDTRERHSERWFAERVEAGVRTRYADVATLSGLAERHQLGLVSNNYDGVVRTVVDHHDLPPFAFVRGRDPGVEGFHRRKPDPHYLKAAVAALGADHGLYVGDRETDLLAAERAGLDGVLLRREHNADIDPAVDPAAELDSLADLETLLGG
ncbi:HAD family hydrolase [Salinirubellus salinus]|uniref:HAD family hydrolase n=1 Tax=Salinirubellus salinus TaxID=1364945 RepID=A0A9E7R2J1_9EURY|nr:HAD family hydrolase [Salinirubellus salinus]UWM53455.1 HAD family hydrolase [Salinirubellus salinus]